VLVAGCSRPAADRGPYTARPVLGQCWEATQAQAAEWMDWQGASPVECSEEHTLETVGVVPVEGDYPEAVGGEYPEEFVKAANLSCESAWEKSTGWADRPNRFSNFLFYPTLKQFTAGQRWVRCDVGLFRTGTLWNSDAHQLQVLTQSLAELKVAQKKDPNIVTLCLDSADDQIGVFGEKLRVADCDQPHLWTLVSENDVSQGKDEKYPGNDEVQSRAEQMCIEEKPDSVTGWFWISPSPDEWKAGKRTSFCFWASVPVTSA
jgi:hypothetical protein